MNITDVRVRKIAKEGKPIRSTPRQEIICRKLFLRHMRSRFQNRKWNKRSKKPKVCVKPWAFLTGRSMV